MIWTALSVLVCIALAVKLVFFSDHIRCRSRFFYRFMLLLSAVYAFQEVVCFIYTPGYEVSPATAIFHMALLVGAFFIKPENLPKNHTREEDRRRVA
jgi:hypothetical protein